MKKLYLFSRVAVIMLIAFEGCSTSDHYCCTSNDQCGSIHGKSTSCNIATCGQCVEVDSIQIQVDDWNDASVGTTFNSKFTTSGGIGPYTWEFASSDLDKLGWLTLTWEGQNNETARLQNRDGQYPSDPTTGDGIPLTITVKDNTRQGKKIRIDNQGASKELNLKIINVVANPTFNPPPGTYPTNQAISLSCDTSGANIYYTTDGITTPTTASTPYTGTPITVTGPNNTMSIMAIAVKEGMSQSSVASATYTVRYQYQLTINSLPGGSTSPPSPVTVDHGAVTNIMATPDTGYRFVNWTVAPSSSGVSFGKATDASTTVTLIGGDATIQANFTPIQYQLTVTAGNGGTVTVPSSSSVMVNYGVATDIIATPNTGYSFSNWSETVGIGVGFGNKNSASTTVTLTGGNATILAKFIPNIITVAGNGTAGYSGDNGPATSAQINTPGGVVVDSSGNMYIADFLNSRIRKVDTFGIITTVAGNGTSGYSGDNGSATSAQISLPTGVAVNSSGNMYIADTFNHRIRKVDTYGIITTVAGNGTAGYSGDNGPATSSQIHLPYGVAVNSSGNLYIADALNYCIRKVDTYGIITTVAGNGTAGYSGDNGPATSAELGSAVDGVAVDSSGNLYIADALNHRIRKVDTYGIITTVAGNGTAGYSGDNGPATSAQVNAPSNVAVDSSGNIYIADYNNNRIQKVDTYGIITTVAGNGTAGYSGDNGTATSAQVNAPFGVAVDSSGNIYITDSNNNRIRKVFRP